MQILIQFPWFIAKIEVKAKPHDRINDDEYYDGCHYTFWVYGNPSDAEGEDEVENCDGYKMQDRLHEKFKWFDFKIERGCGKEPTSEHGAKRVFYK